MGLLRECQHCCANYKHHSSNPVGQLLSPESQLLEQEDTPKTRNKEACLHDCTKRRKSELSTVRSCKTSWTG